VKVIESRSTDRNVNDPPIGAAAFQTFNWGRDNVIFAENR
jgi:hypothetical protein